MSSSVLIIAAHFAPENASGTHRPLHFARSLVDAGLDVQVVTLPLDRLKNQDPRLADVFPHPRAIHRVSPRPTMGDAYMAVKHRWRGGGAETRHAGATEAAIPSPGAVRPVSAIRRFVAEVDVFPDRYASWRVPATRAAVAVGRQCNASVVFASGPPWTALRVGETTARSLGVPFIADFRDPWTRRTGAHADPDFRTFRILAARWEQRVVTAADVVLFNSKAVAQATAAGYPSIDQAKLRVILNGSDAPRRAAPVSISQDTPIRFRHFGTLYQGRSLEPLLHALRDEPRAVDLELYGTSEWRAQTRVPTLRITERGTVAHSAALAAMREPAILVLVQPQHFDRQIPTKLFEYLCTGNPVLVLASRHSAAWALAAPYARCLLLEYGAEASHGSTISALLDQWRSGSLRQEATAGDTDHFTKASVGREFVDMVRDVTRSGGSPGDESSGHRG